MAGAVTYDFVEKLSEECTCAICTNVLTDPVLTGCCGQEFCESCFLKQLMKRNNTCPQCGKGEIRHMKNIRTKRAIDNLRVYCPNKARGCKEVVTIGSYNDHLGKCLFAMVNCKFNCGTASKIRKSIQQHEHNECQNREVKCRYCGEEGMYKDITTEKHTEYCICFPLPCPNKCGVTGIQRQNIPAHKETCPLEPVECSFGCEVKPARKDLDQHLAESMGHHLALVAVRAKRDLQLGLAKVERQLNELTTSVECVKQELSEMTHDPENEKQIATIRTALTAIMEQGTRYCLKLVRYSGSRNIYGSPSFNIQSGYKMKVDLIYTKNWSGKEQYGLDFQPGDYDNQVCGPKSNNIEMVLESEDPACLGGKTRLTIPLCSKCDVLMDLRRVRGESLAVYTRRFDEHTPGCDHFYLYTTIQRHNC